MARVNLTFGRIRDFSCKPGVTQAFLWDSGSPWLAVRATAAGAKSFIFQSNLQGKTVRMTIGDVRAWGIDKAREEARNLQVLIDKGIDPRLHKAEQIAVLAAKQEEARRQGATVGDAWTSYLEARRPKWSERHLANHTSMAKPGGEKRARGRRPGEPETTQPGPLFPLLSMPLCALDGDAVKAWLEPLASRTPTQAAQTYRALRAFLHWCSAHPDYRDQAHPEACNRRMARETLPRAKAKSDCLQREQLAPWFEQVRKIRNPVISAYLQALLLTGPRREELAGLKWKDVDFRWRSLTLRDKVEGERTIPLTPYVASLLADLKRRNEYPPTVRKLRRKAEPTKEWKPSLWVFASPTAASGRLQEPRIQHVKAQIAAGIPPVSLHGLRRSFGTLAEWVEAPVGIVAQIQGHKPSATAEKHYRVRPLDLLRLWHTKIEAWILEQAGIEQPGEGDTGKELKVVGQP